jgi:ATP synthase protein I
MTLQLMKEKKSSLKLIGLLTTVGVNLVVTTFVGFYFGLWLDSVWNTSPILTIIFFFFGVVSGFIYLIRLALRAIDSD